QETGLPVFPVLDLLLIYLVDLDREVVRLIYYHLNRFAVDGIVDDRLVLDVFANLYLRLTPEDNFVAAPVEFARVLRTGHVAVDGGAVPTLQQFHAENRGDEVPAVLRVA